MAGSVLAVSAWLTASHWPGQALSPAAIDRAGALHLPVASAYLSWQAGAGPRLAGSAQLPAVGRASLPPVQGPTLKRAPHAAQHRGTQARQPAAALPAYRDPLRRVSGLIPERIDMGADFAGTGPVYALGNAVITNATADSAGWPGGGWITYRLTNGPESGLMVYVAEDVTPTVRVGQHVSSSTVIANMFAGGDGIETGWAQPDGSSAESQLPVAGSISGGGPFPTAIGLNFEELLQSLGVPVGNNRAQPAYGLLPAGYP